MLRNQSLPSRGDLIDGKFRVLGLLGEGGMGVVFEAVNVATEKHVALKFLSPELALSPEACERFKLEARATGRIHHPNVVAVHDCGLHDGSLFLVLELLRGMALRKWLANRRLDLGAACRILVPVMRGVSAAHAAGVLHRDLKPDNIFLADSPDGLEPVPKVLDFGLAKLSSAADKNTQLSAIGAVMGTYQFMAPEQLRSQGELDARADVYAIGAILFQMLAGRPPYGADNPVDLALQILESEAPPISAHASVPPGAVPVIARALARDRNMRYASVDEFAIALEPFAEGTRFRGSAKRASAAPPPRAAAAFSLTEQFNAPALSTPYRPSEVTVVKQRRSLAPLVLGLAVGIGGLVVAGLLVLKPGATPAATASPAPASAPAEPPHPALREQQPTAVDQRPQAPAPKDDSEGITFEEPAAAGAEWGGAQETWPSPLPDDRANAARRGAREPPAPLVLSTEQSASPRERRHRSRRHGAGQESASRQSAANETQAPEDAVAPAVSAPAPEGTKNARRSIPSTRATRGGLLEADEF